MKYIEKVRKINADEETYIAGVNLEITNIELFVIKEALKIVNDKVTDLPIHRGQFEETLAKLEKVEELMDKGFVGENTEIE